MSNKECWKDKIADVLRRNVKSPYDQHISEYIEFLERLYRVWSSSSESIKRKYRYHMSLLAADSSKENIVRAKLNSFYAYLVYRGHVSAYRLMRSKLVAGGESVYTWLRMYREILGGQQPTS